MSDRRRILSRARIAAALVAAAVGCGVALGTNGAQWDGAQPDGTYLAGAQWDRPHLNGAQWD
jgi:hypothetical protein